MWMNPRGDIVLRAAAVLLACTYVNTPAGAETVTIHRDDWGVPHIYAGEESLGYYGLGYAQAEDQLTKLLGGVYWMMGRQAELTGAADLAGDIERRRWRHLETAERGLVNLSPALRRNYAAFVAGVDRYLADHPERKPVWAPKLDVSVLLAISRAALWSAYAAVEGPRECGARASAAATPGQSNGWVVAPERTAIGATILLADPHVELQNPLYYEYRMHAGRLHSAGFALGALLWQAHNREVAWAMTTGNPDMWDCYAIDVDPSQPSHYRYDDSSLEIERRDETFKAAGAAPVVHTFEYTRHNGVLSPIVARRGNVVYAVSASQADDAGILDEEIYRMNLAASTGEVEDALRSLGMFPQNLVIGDRAGHILYLRAGKTPRRAPGYDYRAPLPGNTSKSAWLGYHPFEDLVRVSDPPQGYLQNDNVAPDRLFADGNLRATDYPSYLFNDVPGRVTSRGLRAIAVLSANPRVDLSAASALATDTMWITTTDWRAALAHAVSARPDVLLTATPDVRKFVDRLLEFDGDATADSIAALDFYYWRRGMGAVLARPELAAQRMLPWQPEHFTPHFDAALLDRAVAAVDEMRAELGSIDIALGAVFRIGRGERSWPLGGESIEMPDVADCLAAYSPLCERTMRAFASTPLDERRERRAFRGSQALRLVAFTQPLQAFSLHLYGQSDDPASVHYDDQAKLASERRLKSERFEMTELEGHIESTQVIDVQRTAAGEWR